MRLGSIALFILLGLVAVAWLSLPEPQFSQDFSKAIYSADGELLSARVSADEQWRFRIEGTLSDKYVQASLALRGPTILLSSWYRSFRHTTSA